MRVPDYTIKRSPKAKNIRLKVTPQEGLAVVVPRDFDEKKIPAILRRKKDWIAEKLEQAAERKRHFEPQPVVHLPESLPLRALSREYQIVYRKDDSKSGHWLRASGREIIISAGTFDRSAVIAKLKEWLRLTVREELFPLVRQIAGKNGFDLRGLLVKSQRTRWASCSAKKNLSVNTKLLFLPPDLVRYVFIHELCHTVHMNHSSEFWRLVACHEPAYRTLDSALRDAWKQVPPWALWLTTEEFVKSKLPNLIKEVRHDLSDWVWHFTRRDGQPFETLKKIVASNRVLGSQDRFCTEKAVCLTEMPLTGAYRQSKLLDANAYNRFSDYGIGFKKGWIAGKGGLPVIYQPNSMLTLLDPSVRWRHCELDFSKGIDFTWQREWRVPGDELGFTQADEVLIVVRTGKEAMEIATDNWEFDHERDEVYFEVIWSYVTHDDLAAAKRPADIEILRTATE